MDRSSSSVTMSSFEFTDSQYKHPRNSTSTPRRPPSFSSILVVVLTMLVATLLAASAFSSIVYGSIMERSIPPLGIPVAVQQQWAQYSPFFPTVPYSPPPADCAITQVNLLQRHGARFPTASAGQQIQASVAKLQSVKDFKNPNLDFLKTFTYTLGHDDLIPFGAAQSSQAGQTFFQRYEHLFTKEQIPFVRASSSNRVVQSATNWTAGIAFASHNKFQPVLSVILNEAANDTLDDNMCPNAGSADPQTNAWQAVYAVPAQNRLNHDAPGANLTVADISNLISLCPFETLANEAPSNFCDIFTFSDFQGFEYFGDLNKYYGTGYGQALGRVQGVGYVNELLARLTSTPVQDNTQTNHTLDSSPSTFPLNRTLYADFSHDNQLIAIYSAIGLFKNQPAGKNGVVMDPTNPNPQRTWIASQLVPFSGNMVTEKLACGSGKNKEEFVRILVDDEVQPLEFCGKGNGLCTLDAFVQSQAYARADGEGDFEKCFS